jgi:transposase
VRASRVWRKVLGVERTTVSGFTVEGDGADQVVIVDVYPTRVAAGRCSQCGRRCSGYDQGGGVRRWRGLDLGTVRVFLQAPGAAGEVQDPRCGRRVGAVGAARCSLHQGF